MADNQIWTMPVLCVLSATWNRYLKLETCRLGTNLLLSFNFDNLHYYTTTTTTTTTMHTFTIAFISSLSLSVYAASIGDPLSQLVTREQHNRHFYNPDFASVNHPATESLEPAGKISQRQLNGPLGVAGMLGIVQGVNTVNGQAPGVVVVAQTLDQGAGVALAQNPVTPQVLNLQGTGVAQAQNLVTAQAQGAGVAQAQNPVIAQAQGVGVAQVQNPVIAQAQGAGVVQVQNPVIAQAQNLVTPQAQSAGVAQVQNPVIAQAQGAGVVQPQNPVTAQAQGAGVVQAQNPVTAEALSAQGAVAGQVVAGQAPNAQTSRPSVVLDSLAIGPALLRLASGRTLKRQQSPVATPAVLGGGLPSLPISLPSNSGTASNALKRQLPALVPGTSVLPIGTANTAVETREDSLDDQIEDMDFSEHEADELENFEEGL